MYFGDGLCAISGISKAYNMIMLLYNYSLRYAGCII